MKQPATAAAPVAIGAIVGLALGYQIAGLGGALLFAIILGAVGLVVGSVLERVLPTPDFTRTRVSTASWMPLWGTALTGVILGVALTHSAGVSVAVMAAAFYGALGLLCGWVIGRLLDITGRAVRHHWRVVVATAAIALIVLAGWNVRF